MKQPRIYTIPAHLPFAEMLARDVLERYGAKPEALSRVRLLLPSRRAARAMKEAFLRASGGVPLLLPRMAALGDVDEEALALDLFASDAASGAELAALPPVMPETQRIFMLARLIGHWHVQRFEHHLPLERAVQLAVELARFMDEVAREACSYDGLAALVPEEYAEHWQDTLDFLSIVTLHWPQALEEAGMTEPVARRASVMRLLAESWTRHPPDGPVIAAGSTGSIPATAQLLKVVAALPQGMIVLPAIDADRPDIWEAMEETHPQRGLRNLLAQLGVSPSDVLPLNAACAGPASPRYRLLREALLPPPLCGQSEKADFSCEAALSGLHRIDCMTREEEAETIALLLRESLESPEKTAALVTRDRKLARMAAAKLKRYGVAIDDSAGALLEHSESAVFLDLTMQAVASRMAPVALLALLKHPLAALGMEAAELRRLTRKLEVAVLRGMRVESGIAGLRGALAAENKADASLPVLLDGLERATGDFSAALELRHAACGELFSLHLRCAERLAANPSHSGAARLWSGEAGRALAAALSEIHHAMEKAGRVETASYAGLLRTLLAGKAYRPQVNLHPRLHILSPMEARLQQYDRIVLGGLDEGRWPEDISPSPWMSRPMRARFGLPPPERRIGQSAHDFMMLACAPEVYITRAERIDGAPSVPSRWLLRIDAVLRQMQAQGFTRGAAPYLAWARQLHAGEYSPRPAPAPIPPLASRPARLSATQVERLMRDPYSVYASHILKLKALDPIDQEPGAADLGTIIHAALERFCKAYPHGLPMGAYEKLLAIGREAFAPFLHRPAVQAFWWPRFARAAEWWLREHRARLEAGARVIAECQGIWQVDDGFTLTARLDRLERYRDEVAIVDYKTGAPPKQSDVDAGIANQLILEALIAEHGSIGDAAPGGCAPVNRLEYWQLKGGEEGGEVKSVSGKRGADILKQEARSGLRQLIAAYRDPAYPYYCNPQAARAPRYNDYAHLERVAEWSNAG